MVPTETPLTTPVVEPIVPTDVLLLIHVPPVVASVNVIEEPTHIMEDPIIEAGGVLKNNSTPVVVPVRPLAVQVSTHR